MSKWRVLVLAALLALAFGIESVVTPEQGRVAMQLAALGALIVFVVFCYLWWRAIALATRVVLVFLAMFGVAFLLHRSGILGVG